MGIASGGIRVAWLMVLTGAFVLPQLPLPVLAQSGQNGCYFGECPGGRPPAPSQVPAPLPAAPSISVPPAQSRPAKPSSGPRAQGGPKVDGNFCKVILELADMVDDDFDAISGRRSSGTTLATKKSLPGADTCAVYVGKAKNANHSFLCIWEIDQPRQVLSTFVKTVSNCFDGADTEELNKEAHRISATDSADILIVADSDEHRLILEIKASE